MLLLYSEMEGSDRLTSSSYFFRRYSFGNGENKYDSLGSKEAVPDLLQPYVVQHSHAEL